MAMYLVKFWSSEIQVILVSFQMHDVTVTLAGVYCPFEKTNSNTFFHEFFQTLGNRWIEGSDFNDKHNDWGSCVIEASGHGLRVKLVISTENYPFFLSFFFQRGANLLVRRFKLASAFARLLCNPRHFHWLYVAEIDISDLSSNHSPVLLTISFKGLRKIIRFNLGIWPTSALIEDFCHCFSCRRSILEFDWRLQKIWSLSRSCSLTPCRSQPWQPPQSSRLFSKTQISRYVKLQKD